MILQQFDREEFIQTYWQKKPLLIKHQGSDFSDPISAEELAGLACEDEVESRLITASGNGSLQLKHGPFTESLFGSLGNRNWTLLVQAVDQYIAAVDALKTNFDFIPRWRIDDIMVSFACEGGGVGPHYDQYDVFLIQGSGSRKWELGPRCNNQTPLRSDTELRVLGGFQAECEFILTPGDILYLPPRIAHHGISIGDSLCYSVGFRAPSIAELIQGYTDVLADTLNEDQRYTDSLTAIQPQPDELTENAVDVGFSRLMEIINNKTAFTDWFGSYISTPRYPERVVELDSLLAVDHLIKLVNDTGQVIELNKNSSSRFSYFTANNKLKLFVDGQCFIIKISQLNLIRRLCESTWAENIPASEYVEDRDTASILASLINQGSLLISTTE